MAWHKGIWGRGQSATSPQVQPIGFWRWRIMAQQVYRKLMLNIPWGDSMLVMILLSSIQSQQNWTACIATSWMLGNKEKSRHTTRSAMWNCASTRIRISSSNGTLNSYYKHKLMLTLWHIFLVFLDLRAHF